MSHLALQLYWSTWTGVEPISWSWWVVLGFLAVLDIVCYAELGSLFHLGMKTASIYIFSRHLHVGPDNQPASTAEASELC